MANPAPSSTSLGLGYLWPVDDVELGQVRERLEVFAGQVFASLPRRDQQDKGATYLRGLLLDGARKSMQPMAARLGVDHQGLQQFVTSSTWDVAPVRAALAARAVDVVGPDAWVVDDTGFPKDGTASPGVARQYSGTLGKVGNCQIAVSVHAATDAASAPLDWRLFLPARWDPAHAEDEEAGDLVRDRRARASIPDEVAHRPKWQLALDMIDELATWGQRPPALCADAGYGNNGDFRHGLATRGLSYIVQVEDDLTAFALDAAPVAKAYPGVGPYPKPRYRTAPIPLHEHIATAVRQGSAQVVDLSWRRGSRGTMTGTFVAIRVRPAGRSRTHRLNPDGTLEPAWLLAQWPDGAPEPVQYWLSNLGEDTPIAELVRLGKIRWRIEHDYRELKQALGLDHFEGRTFAGWHRHVTPVSAAHLFATTLRTDADPKAPGAA